MDNREMVERLREAYCASLGSHQDRAFLNEAADLIERQASQLSGVVGERDRLESAKWALMACMAIAPKKLKDAINLNGNSAFDVCKAAVAKIDAALNNTGGQSDG